jgi:hypothetical protein
MRAIVRKIVGQIGNVRRIGNPPGPVLENCRGRLTIGRRLSTCPTILVCLTFSILIADTHNEIVDVVSYMANALSTVNLPKFMDAIDKSMPDYDKLKSKVAALMNQTEITSSIETVKEEGDDTTRTVDLDWYLEIRSLAPDGPIERRREIIHCELLRKDKKHWKIASLKPLDFFAPAKLDK